MARQRGEPGAERNRQPTGRQLLDGRDRRRGHHRVAQARHRHRGTHVDPLGGLGHPRQRHPDVAVEGRRVVRPHALVPERFRQPRVRGQVAAGWEPARQCDHDQILPDAAAGSELPGPFRRLAHGPSGLKRVPGSVAGQEVQVQAVPRSADERATRAFVRAPRSSGFDGTRRRALGRSMQGLMSPGAEGAVRMTPMARRAVIGAIPLGLVVAYVAVPGFAESGGSTFNAYNLCAVVSATILIGAVAVGRPRPMWPWLLIAGAVLAWVVGDAVYSGSAATRSSRLPSVLHPCLHRTDRGVPPAPALEDGPTRR